MRSLVAVSHHPGLLDWPNSIPACTHERVGDRQCHKRGRSCWHRKISSLSMSPVCLPRVLSARFHNQSQIHPFEGGQIPRSSNCLEGFKNPFTSRASMSPISSVYSGTGLSNGRLRNPSGWKVYLNDALYRDGLLLRCLSHEEAQQALQEVHALLLLIGA